MCERLYKRGKMLKEKEPSLLMRDGSFRLLINPLG